VLTGDVEGNALAFDAANGAVLWTFNTGSGHRGSPITYAVGGKQYIAVPSGWGGVAARGFSRTFPALADAPRGSTLFVFGLPEE
jgi:alcohol dehydrogenase (cytochrome c)